jgi:hypothetical protein
MKTLMRQGFVFQNSNAAKLRLREQHGVAVAVAQLVCAGWDFSSVGQVVGHRNCRLFFVLVVETLAMAYARFGKAIFMVTNKPISLACAQTQ